MDILTHALRGADAGGALARRRGEGAAAAATGALAALLPDADVLIRSAEDPLLVLDFHRQFSHSLLAVPFGALLAAWLAAAFARVRRRPRPAFPRLLVFAAAGYASAVLLDACTSYGTQLLWPFSDARIAWRVVAVVDPAFTLGIAALLAAGAARARSAHRWSCAALCWACLYLALGLLQRERAAALQAELADSRQHLPAERAIVKPTLGNLVLWRGVYLHEGRWHVDAFRAGLPGRTRVYEGESAPVLDAAAAAEKWGLPPESLAAADLARFEGHSDGYLAPVPGIPHSLGDIRHSMRPDSAAPLWGVVVDPAQPERRPRFETWREAPPELRAALLDMLRGR